MEVWNAFLDEEPYSVILDHQGEGRHELRIEQDISAPPVMSVLLGEWLQNLRTALNYCVYDVAIHDSRQNPPPKADKLEFPIYQSRHGFASQSQKIEPLTERHRRWIKEMQPFPNTSDQTPVPAALFWLNELARVDRHRALHVVTGYVVESNPIVRGPGIPIFEKFEPERIVLDGQTVIARFQVTPWVEGQQVEANPQSALDPEISEWAMQNPGAAFWREFTFTERLRAIEGVVKAIVGRFERDCTGWTRVEHILLEEPDPMP